MRNTCLAIALLVSITGCGGSDTPDQPDAMPTSDVAPNIDVMPPPPDAMLVESACQDLIDNDQDGLTDCADSDCATDPECIPETNCSDGIDNEGDGEADC